MPMPLSETGSRQISVEGLTDGANRLSVPEDRQAIYKHRENVAPPV